MVMRVVVGMFEIKNVGEHVIMLRGGSKWK